MHQREKMSDYVVLLKEKGLKATFQRTNILEVVEKHGHMSVEDIYTEVIKVHPSLSLATIYKNIILMQEHAIVREVPISGKKSKYELVKADHLHFICTGCGSVEDYAFPESAEQQLLSLAEERHFMLEREQINLYGMCQTCQKTVFSL